MRSLPIVFLFPNWGSFLTAARRSRTNGNGIQSIYLTEVPLDFAEVLAGLIGEEARPFISAADVTAGIKRERMMIGDDLDV